MEMMGGMSYFSKYSAYLAIWTAGDAVTCGCDDGIEVARLTEGGAEFGCGD